MHEGKYVMASDLSHSFVKPFPQKNVHDNHQTHLILLLLMSEKLIPI